LTADEFARLFPVRAKNIAWFLGAGASAPAGVPTGYDMILDCKATLYTQAVGLARAQIDPSDPLWEARINGHFDSANGFPPAGHPTEYSVAFEAMYPNPRDRRAYIEQQVRKGTASYPHRLLASLISAKFTLCAVTTNFDQLIERTTVITDELLSPGDRANMTVSAIDNAERGERVIAESAWPLLLKLHGDYQELALKNTSDELRTQDERQRATLIEVCRRFGLLVVGYSGRDESVMDALREAATSPGAFPGGLFWIQRPGHELLPEVSSLLEVASTSGVETHRVVVSTFDDLAAAIARTVTLPEPLSAHVSQAVPQPLVVPVTVSTTPGAYFPVLRCSALPILEAPSQARSVTLATAATTREVRDQLRGKRLNGVVAASLGKQVAAFGRDSDIIEALRDFEPELAGTIDLDPRQDSWAAGLLVDALANALAYRRPLRRRQHQRLHSLLVRPPRNPGSAQGRAQADRLASMQRAYGAPLVGTVPKTSMAYAEAVHIRMEHRANRWWAVFEPFTWVDLPRDDDSQRLVDVATDWRREHWAQRYNNRWFEIIAAWSELLTGATVAELAVSNLAPGNGVAGSFRLSNVTGWSRPSGPAGSVRSAGGR
jgi:NAD-dependent SIR2 family protein deacetylase